MRSFEYEIFFLMKCKKMFKNIFTSSSNKGEIILKCKLTTGSGFVVNKMEPIIFKSSRIIAAEREQLREARKNVIEKVSH